MDFYLNDDGYFSFSGGGIRRITHAPLGIHVYRGCACLPTSCSIDGEMAVIRYPHGDCTVRIEDKQKYIKITLCEVPDGTTGFIFGPYATEASGFGEILGAGWNDDGSVVCIQSLMPKVEEGIIPDIVDDRTGLQLNRFQKAACKIDSCVWLHCSVKDRTKDIQRKDGFVVKALDGEDGRVEGASIALLYGINGDDLLDCIGEMELAEGLPHPTYLGNYAKKDKRISAFYFVFDGPHMTNEERIEAAKRANVSCVYFCDLFEKWGHFTINLEKFPGGVAEVARGTAAAYDSGIISGAHSLSNFIHTNDAYVTPVPHDQLLIKGTTVLAETLDKSSKTVAVTDATNCTAVSNLNVFRIGDELITFAQYDPQTKRFEGCTRGAFGTVVDVHEKGSIIQRLVDHPYKTLFPDIRLQNEMAERLGNQISECGIRKISFDGLEGCYETGHGNYAVASYVKRVVDIVGSELLCDSSVSAHYLWHALVYNNWGEPFWDTGRRGGTYVYRARNQIYFKRNLLPCMLGWYTVFLCSANGRWEATSPENMEYILSRSAAFDAGAALCINTETVKGHGLINAYYDMVRIWNRFRLEADIPDDVRERMKEENSNWHLEVTEDGWNLTELIVRTFDLEYCDRVVHTEGGQLGSESERDDKANRIYHSTIMNLDTSYPIEEANGLSPYIATAEEEPIRFRIRVGTPGCGYMEDLHIYDQLHFSFCAEGGEYLVYEGGTTLYRYDKNYNLLEAIEGTGSPLIMPFGRPMLWGEFRFTTDTNPQACYLFTEFRRKRTYHIKSKI